MAAPAELKVALITLCVPSTESVDVITQQLGWLKAVRYPHDTWVLDEGADPRVKEAATRYGVKYFSRNGVDRYNQSEPPFTAKTKAGNVNAWLDAHGHNYDFFVQFDVDHLPDPGYLDKVLGYFQDPGVAWVQGPSLYHNLDTWIARGSAEQELVLQGPLQMGFFGNSETPFIIGSHCTYRTRAINEIGGFQPTRAEDHLDTVMLAARGYRGVFVPEILALGGGPDTFDTYLRQQFAWAYSMMQVLFQFTPKLLFHYRPLQAVQFIFAQTWYVCWSTSMLVLFALPLLALLADQRPANTSLLEFAGASVPLGAITVATWLWTRQWQLPHDVSLTWRGMVLHIARWPIVFWALLNVIFQVKHPYMITPKGEVEGVPAFSMRSQAIYLFAAWLSAAILLWYLRWGTGYEAQGHMLFALAGIFFMLLVVAANVLTDHAALRRRGLSLMRSVSLRAVPVISLSVSISFVALVVIAGNQQLYSAATWTGNTPYAVAFPGAARARAILLDAASPASAASSVSLGKLAPAPQVEVAGVTVRPGITLGAYDPWQELAPDSLTYEHWYVRQDEPALLAGALARTRGAKRPLITIEPYAPGRQRQSALDRVQSGAADSDIRSLARVVRAASPQPVLIRWGHEMDLSLTYPWSSQEPALYRAAYRRVVQLFREEGAANAQWVWSPAGEPGASRYFPGDDVVDFVGLTVLADQDWDRRLGYSRRSLSEVLRPRYEEVIPLGKPVIIAELGVSGTVAEQSRWLAQGASDLGAFPLVQAAIYFNDRNAPNNLMLDQPNWRLSSATLAHLLGGQLPEKTPFGPKDGSPNVAGTTEHAGSVESLGHDLRT